MKRTKQILATIISLIILTFFVSSAHSQVWEGDYHINNSDDIAALSGYTEVTGFLSISDTALTSPSGLKNITSIGGNLYIHENYALTSLSGLENLTSVGDSLYIKQPHPLPNIPPPSEELYSILPMIMLTI